MKKALTLLVAGVPATALAHPGHPEAAGPMGHDIAHLLIGCAVATALFIAVQVVRKVRRDREV